MGGQLIVEFQPQTGKYYYYASGQVNSTRIVLDENAVTVYSTSYGPFGQELNTPTGTFDPKLKYSGKEREGYSDLDYFGARYYDHQSFRFNSIYGCLCCYFFQKMSAPLFFTILYVDKYKLNFYLFLS
jgi:hypothetical protein